MERKEYSLSHPQKRVWFTEQIFPDTPIHNIGGYLKIHNSVDTLLLKKAINRIIEKNDSLRTKVFDTDGEQRQYIEEYIEEDIPFFDFSTLGENAFSNWFEEEMKTPFELENNFLYYTAVFKLPDQTGGILLKLHHIISDGWSFELIGKRVMTEYCALLTGKEPDYYIEGSYHNDYLHKEKEYLKSERFDKDRSFWNNKFSKLNEYFFLKNPKNLASRRKSYSINPGLTARLKQFISDNKISANAIFVAAMTYYLYAISGHTDITIGTPVANRSGRKEKAIVGMFTSSMPLRISVKEDEEVLSFLRNVNTNILECFFHQKYPYDCLLKDLKINASDVDGLFNMCVNYYNTGMNDDIGGLKYSCHEVHCGYLYYPLQMVVRDWGVENSFTIDFDYRYAEFSEYQIDNMFKCINSILTGFVENQTSKLKDISLLSQNTLNELIYSYNDHQATYPNSTCIHKLIEEQVERTPDRIALRLENEKLTYRTMNRRANQLARKLMSMGLTHGKTSAIMTHHSIETVIAILAVLKAGGAYVPIDPSYPEERVRFMLEDSEAVVLLVNYQLDVNIVFAGETCDIREAATYSGLDTNLDTAVSHRDLSYIIYTSGSTGKPKGVMIEHRGLVNYIWWARKTYVKSIDDSFALYSSLAFDLTVTSIFTPLIGGNSIYIYPDNREKFVLYRILDDNCVTIVKLTPAHLSLLKDGNYKGSSVRCFIVGGDDLKVELAKDIYRCFGRDIDIYNEYGPTETVVGCMIHRFDINNDTNTSVPIGIPADNVQIYLLDGTLNPVPEGVAGEMYISGDGVARGYLKREELSKERFIANPFIPNSRMYKTGDMARFVEDGIIEYLGRKDFQVKIKGFRIETGEIEKKILEYGDIAETIVIDRLDEHEEKYLCAYLVVKKLVDISGLKQFMSGYLPHYMIPRSFVVIERIPLTSNGKIDRNKLPVPNIVQVASKASYLPPQNEMEEQVSEIFQAVLGIDKIGVEDDFFETGGDSIKAIQISSRLSSLGIKVKARDVMSHGTVRKLLQYAVFEQRTIKENGIDISGRFKGTPVLQWFIGQQLPCKNYYNQSVLFSIDQNVRDEWIDEALDATLKQHDSLWLAYDESEKLFSYHNSLDTKVQEFKAQRVDLTMLDTYEQKQKMEAVCIEIKSSLNIKAGMLAKACIFDLGHSGKRLLVTIHHIGVDGVSWRILIDDIVSILNCKIKGLQYSLPYKTSAYIEWARVMEEYAHGRAQMHKQYWENVVKSACIAGNELSCSYTAQGYKDELTDNPVWTKLLHNEVNLPFINDYYKYGVKTEEILVCALVETLSFVAGTGEVVIEMEGHGREDIDESIDISRTVGWFTSIYPVKFQYADGDVISEIKHVKQQLRHLPDNGLSFGALKYICGYYEDYDSKRQIRFNYLGEFQREYDNKVMTIAEESTGSEASPDNPLNCKLEINAMSIGDVLKIMFDFDEKALSRETAQKLIIDYCKNIQKILSRLHEAVFTGILQDTKVWKDEVYAAACSSLQTTAKLSEDDLNELFI